MSDSIHSMAPHDLPRYLAGPDGSDPLFGFIVVLLVLILMVVGNFYLKLHALPEHMAHRQNNTQLQIIAVLTLLALFTHNNVFWVGALLLASVRLPDFSTPLNTIARSLEKIATASSQSDDTAPPANDGNQTRQAQSSAKEADND